MLRARALAVIVVMGSCPVARTAAAASQLGDGFDLERFSLSAPEDRFTFVPEPEIKSHTDDEQRYWGVVGLRLVGLVAPVVVATTTQNSIVEKDANTLRAHVQAAWVRWKPVEFMFDVPIVLCQRDVNDTPGGFVTPVGGSRVGRAPSPGDLGDVRVGVRLGAPIADFDVALQSVLATPTGDHERLAGDAAVRSENVAIAGLHVARFSFAASFGFAVRSTVELQSKEIGSGFLAGLGASYALGRFDTSLETRFDQIGGYHPPFGGIGAAGARFWAWHRLAFTASAIFPVAPAPGVPDFGATFGILVLPATEPVPPSAPSPAPEQ